MLPKLPLENTNGEESKHVSTARASVRPSGIIPQLHLYYAPWSSSTYIHMHVEYRPSDSPSSGLQQSEKQHPSVELDYTNPAEYRLQPAIVLWTVVVFMANSKASNTSR